MASTYTVMSFNLRVIVPSDPFNWEDRKHWIAKTIHTYMPDVIGTQEATIPMLEWLKEMELKVPIIHCGNSATSLRYPEKVFNMFRLGISMYGLTPSPEIKDQLPVRLKPAFSLKTRLVQVKQMDEGEAISYGATYRTSGREWIGTLPIGYADGWLRYHSEAKGEVLVSGKRAPFVGRICMDQCMIKLPEEVPVGTIVTLIGKDSLDEVSMDEIATRLQTINYEIPCIITRRVPRVYKQPESVS
jgi:alanine racemase